MRRLAAATVALVALAAGCTDETGLPDLDAVGPEDFPVGETLVIDTNGCAPTAVEVEAGETVVLRAEADGVAAESDDHRYLTGEMREGEETHWLVDAPTEEPIEFECGGDRGTDTGTIEATPRGP